MTKFLKIFINIIVVILFVLIGITFLLPIFGLKLYTVVSGSMEPNIPVGAIVISREVEPQTIELNDVIIFKASNDSSTMITHRVVDIKEEDDEFITKGDNNKDIDINPVNYSQLAGKVVFSLPILGYFYYFLGSLGGKIIMVGVLALLIILSIVLDNSKKKKENE